MESGSKNMLKIEANNPVKVGGIYPPLNRSTYMGFEPSKPVKLRGTGQVHQMAIEVPVFSVLSGMILDVVLVVQSVRRQ